MAVIVDRGGAASAVDASGQRQGGTAPPLRIGVLGAGRIPPLAVLRPAVDRPDVDVVAIASRVETRARALAEGFGIERVVKDYATIIDAEDVDAVYIALPVARHHEWAMAAIAAGKHVLCEKPLAANEAEAVEMSAFAAAAGTILFEAAHWRYHPLADEVIDMVRSGRVGEVTAIRAELAAPIIDLDDIRFDRALGGGAMLDLGCYPVQWTRAILGDGGSVRTAQAEVGPPGIDVTMTGELVFPSEVTATFRASMAADSPPFPAGSHLAIAGRAGTLDVENLVAPHLGNRVLLSTADGHQEFSVEGRSSYRYQLEAFTSAVRSGAPVPTDGGQAAAALRIIDNVYCAAGLEPRGTEVH